MPIYNYGCSSCTNEREIIHRVKEMGNKWACEKCGDLMKRVPPSSRFKLTGKGFHENDYPSYK